MATPRIDWRKLMVPFAFVLVLPSLLAILIDFWLGLFPLVTIVAILICFPAAGFFLNRVTLQELDRVINEVAPLPSPEVEPLPEVEDDQG
jgi:hypothetical protein